MTSESKFKILDVVYHILDPDKKPLMVLGVIERPNQWTYLCSSYDNTEIEYLELELKK